ncbi:twin-arginine translocation signal domain-containing protein, partial [Chroococcidiopsidales cyanobacterium LEGE 13417]|nr:twin-arginine translocation signal domain-containing protein [Chroococcidiopsidales cyanobacterium LEGE 13417]
MAKISRRKLLKTGLAAGGTAIAASSCSNRGPTVITNKLQDVT